MLEGQVAVLSSGVPDPREALAILKRLFASALYRLDQNSFMLYPDKVLPSFLARNVVPDKKVESIPLLKELLASGDTSLLARDADGVCRFHGSFSKDDDVNAALDELTNREDWADMVARDRSAVLDVFEVVFRHKFYTGRSGMMYSYEGLGCIYWHMVAKLLLAVQEVVERADREEQPAALREELARMYFQIRSGLGYEKTVAEYGAFPIDPYSHTPPDGGAKQPGMTGQVKEEILTRFGELGVRVEAGAVRFRPILLRPEEFTTQSAEFCYYDVHGDPRTIALPEGHLAFTYCQVPVIYERVPETSRIHIEFSDGSTEDHLGTTLDTRTSAEIFAHSGKIARIRVSHPVDEVSSPESPLC